MGNVREHDQEAACAAVLRKEPDDRLFYRRLAVLVLLGALAWLLGRIVAPLWQPLAWALLIGILLAPFNRRLAARLGDRRGPASALTLLVVVLALLLPIALLAGELAAQAAHLHGRLSESLGEAGRELTRLESWLQRLGTKLALPDGQVHAWLVGGGRHLLERLASSGGTALGGALGGLANLVLMLFVLFFVLRDGPQVARELVRMLPVDPPRRARLQAHVVNVSRAVFLGIGATAMVHGVLIGVGCWIAGLPSPLVLGLVAALVALIPVIGSALVWIPCVLYLVFQGDHGHAVFLTAWSVILVGLLDHVLRPMLISGRAQVPALAVFVGVLGGLAACGFIGLFVGPIVLGLLVALYRMQSEAVEPGVGT